MTMRDEILQLLNDNEWHCATELIEFGWSARNRISEMRAEHGEDYILGEKCSKHSHTGSVRMYKLNDQQKKQELIKRRDDHIKLELC